MPAISELSGTERPVQVSPSMDESLIALQRLRRCEGVTGQSKLAALECVRPRIDVDAHDLIETCRSQPAIRSAAFYGPVVHGDGFHDIGSVDILIDLDEARLPSRGRAGAKLGELDEMFTVLFGRRTDVATYESIENAMKIRGSGTRLAHSARIFYVR